LEEEALLVSSAGRVGEMSLLLICDFSFFFFNVEAGDVLSGRD
jgi:hypothetical protein